MASAEIIVVGAGLAGLYAARLLRQRGLDPIVLEARDRVGGRTWSRTAAGACVDLGAQWIGPDHRRVRALARELGLTSVRTHVAGDLVFSAGGRHRRAPRTARIGGAGVRGSCGKPAPIMAVRPRDAGRPVPPAAARGGALVARPMSRSLQAAAPGAAVLLALALSWLVAAAVALDAQGQSGVAPLDHTSTDEQILRTVNRVRAGRTLTPASWPNGARVAVGLSFDVDNELLARNAPLPVPLSQGEYGATTALPRILAMLDRQQVPATFFIPAVAAMLHPEMIPAIRKSGRHEIGVHGWIHENLAAIGDAAEEARLMTRAVEYLTQAAGRRPVGFRAPSWAFSEHTLPQILAAGFLYDSSLMARDEPYEVLADGRPTGLVELPVEWILDDFPYFGGNASGALPAPEQVFRIYQDEFDVAYEERTMLILTLHPHVAGHRSRLGQIERLIVYMKSRPGVWFATLEQIATAVAPGLEKAR
jgi:peptidoglycan/xylan/chitin deacetylase (PgdA/CDA1 family)